MARSLVVALLGLNLMTACLAKADKDGTEGDKEPNNSVLEASYMGETGTRALGGTCTGTPDGTGELGVNDDWFKIQPGDKTEQHDGTFAVGDAVIELNLTWSVDAAERPTCDSETGIGTCLTLSVLDESSSVVEIAYTGEDTLSLEAHLVDEGDYYVRISSCPVLWASTDPEAELPEASDVDYSGTVSVP